MTKPTEEVAREWLAEKGLHLETQENVPVHPDLAAAMIGGLVRQERAAAFLAGAEAERRYCFHEVGEELKASDAYDAARRAAVEGEEAPDAE